MELQKPPITPSVPDDEERKRRAFADVDEFTVTTYERSLCKNTKAERERASWRLWNRFVTDVLQVTHKETDKVWFGVCQNKKNSIAICKSFLADYTRYAKCRRLYIDGTEEQKHVPTVQSVVTIIALWKHIVAQADAVVFAKRRDRDSNEDCLATWIQSTLAQKCRLAFHRLVLIGSIGFRPGTYENMLYRQVELLVVRDPDTKGVCILAFNLTFVAIQALHDVIEIEFPSFDELLQRPNLEDVDCIGLRWKDGIQEKPIFPLNHNTKTFETSYQTRHIPHNLMSFVFESTSEDDSKLSKLLASASLHRDDKAPLYPTATMLETSENREDMKALHVQRRYFREELKLSADNREQGRENYFAEVDFLRARGLSTEDMPAPSPNPFKYSF
ncbi:hypothetical protein B0T09DRAFT_341625, partial [Sordaria sp. MPI-SDFR-AT-0083]